MATSVTAVAPELFLIPLTPPLSGFRDFISAWVYRAELTVMIDVGPAATTGQLLGALRQIGVEHLDMILLTHIHLDHAGAIGDVVRAFPQTPVVCHPQALKHLSAPERLWEGSLKTLGATAKAYGPIKNVPAEQLMDSETFSHALIETISTPGHAPHHISFQIGPYLFAGEAGGVYRAMPSGKAYLRPATPPRLFLEVHRQSLDRLMARKAPHICYGHFGLCTEGEMMLRAHREQLQLWEQVIKGRIADPLDAQWREGCLQQLMAEDPWLAGFARLPEEVRAREHYFIHNSIKGFAEYLTRVADDA
jgi:glyoxylase-like metal-dependent hydrolase (beta-lactamase superfamily II)